MGWRCYKGRNTAKLEVVVVINLYSKTETNFYHNGLIILQPIEAIVTEEINGDYSLKITMPLGFSKIENEQIIKAPTPKSDQLFRVYNSDVAKERLEKYLNEVIRIGLLHNASKVHVACIGDLISGSIHKTIQITNRENVIDQIKIASEYISSFCYELTKVFNHVYLYDVPGNHSRIDKKEDAMKDERLDSLISWSVCQSLKHIDNFHAMLHRKFDTTIGEANIRDNNYLLVHGDNDSMTKQGIADLSLMIGFVPKYLIMGHKHVPAMNEFNGVRVYQSGSLAGSGDDYTVQHRMSGNPSQLVLVCNENGVECSYNVDLA